MEIRPGTDGKYRLRDYAKTAGWYSPKVGDIKEGGEQPRRIESRWGPGGVAVQSQLAGWATPCDCMVKGGYTGGKVLDGKLQTNRLDYAAQIAGWPMPLTGSSTFEGAAAQERHRLMLPGAAILSGWHEGNREGEDMYRAHVEHGDSPVYARMAGWRSPGATDAVGNETPERVVGRRGGVQRLMVQSQLAGWPTPDSAEGGGKTYGRQGDNWRLVGAVDLAGSPPTRATDFKTGVSPMVEGGGVRGDLVSVTQLSGWQTPMAGDGEVGPNTKRGVLGARSRLAMWSGDEGKSR